MKLYTGMFIIQPNLTEEAYDAVISDFEKLFKDFNSNVVEVKKWGMKDLAYEINDFKKGYYVVFKVEATPEAVAEYDRVCNIREDVIRHILVKE
jgi:small subunit ribosomal protein S6